jgi:MFS family permease
MLSLPTFAAFKSRNYRLFFAGQSISLMGTWMQRTAVYWVVYVHTHSAFMLGLSAFATQFPSFLFSLLGGTIADRYNRYNVLLLTQILSMLQAIILALVVLFTQYSVTEILLLSTLLGLINAFDVPARQSLMHVMVENKDDLANAIALNTSMVNLARLIGPAVAGVVLESMGAGICFMLNALSFMAVIASLMMMHLPAHIPQFSNKKILADVAEGWHYLRSTPTLGRLVVLLALMSFWVLPYATLLPIVAKETLGGNASTYGYLNSCIGIGALIAAIFLASMRTREYHKRILLAATTLLATGIVLLSLATTLTFAFIFSGLTGFGMMLTVTIVNTLLQTGSDIQMRGRIISYFAMAFFGMQPIGALLIGVISHRIGVAHTLLLEGVVALFVIAWFAPFLLQNETKTML